MDTTTWAMDDMAGLGVRELRERFLSMPMGERPDSFMKSLMQKEGIEAKDAEELMALFITAFQVRGF